MRCPDCSKFVGMETQDPEVDRMVRDLLGDQETLQVAAHAEALLPV